MSHNDTEDNNLIDVEAPGDTSAQLLGISAWLGQAGLFGIAMTFRYSGEPGVYNVLQMPATVPAAWRPGLLDWPWFPLLVAGIFVAVCLLLKTTSKNLRLADAGNVGSLLCLSAFALATGSALTFLSTILGIWLCVVVSQFSFSGNANEQYTASSAAALLVACLGGPYLYMQKGCSFFEMGLIGLSLSCGIISTHLTSTASRKTRLAMPLWFTLLLALSWWGTAVEQPSLRTLVILELSAAFIAARHFALFAQHSSD